MNLVHEKTDILLNAFVELIKPKSQSWRVISIEFQDCETLHSSLFQSLCFKNIEVFFSQSECKIFWHKPGFLLIFFQGRAMPIEKCVEGFLKETEFKGFGRFFDIMDLSIHWNNLVILMGRMGIEGEKKEPVVKAAQSIEKPLQKVAELAPVGFTIELSEEKIKHLKPTRKARTIPLVLLVEDALRLLLRRPRVRH